MILEELFEKLKTEIKALMGEEGKDKVFGSVQAYPKKEAAKAGFSEAQKRLFDVNKWSDLPGINSKFELKNPEGNPKQSPLPEVNDFITIILPGLPVENWVQVIDVKQTENLAEFTVKPSQSPLEKSTETKHFFTQDASSTFRVVLDDNSVKGFEIGKNEVINNQEETNSARAVTNTMIAEGGWAGFQKLQWQKVTDYFVGKVESES